MYALDNVKKFVQDNPEKVGDQAELILKRAMEKSENGILSGSSIEEIFGTSELADEFKHIITKDLEHIRIGLEAIEALR